jgi:hypothetical protein
MNDSWETEPLYDYEGVQTYSGSPSYYVGGFGSPLPGSYPWTGAPDGIMRLLYSTYEMGSVVWYYYTKPILSVDLWTDYTLPSPCDYASNTVGWASSEGENWQRGSADISRSNSVDVKVLVEWQK